LPGCESGIVSNIETATQTVPNAGVEGFLLGSVPDFLIEPEAAPVLTVPAFANDLYASQVCPRTDHLVSAAWAAPAGSLSFSGATASLRGVFR
jgi:hypothetical protein